MAAAEGLSLKVGLDQKEVIDGLKKLNETTERSVKEMQSELQKLTGGWRRVSDAITAVKNISGVLTGAVSGLIDATRDYVKLATVQEGAERKLAAALQMRGEFTDDAFSALKSYASELQGLTTTGDEATLGIMSQLSALGVHTKELDRAAKATIGMAEVTGSVESATKLVARAMRGEVQVLRRWGIEARDASDALAQMEDRFALAEEKAKTFGGRVEQLSNAWGDYKEELGKAITMSPQANAFIDTLRRGVEDLTKLLADPKGRQAVNGFFDSVMYGAMFALTAVSMLLKELNRFQSGLENIQRLGLVRGALTNMGVLEDDPIVEAIADGDRPGVAPGSGHRSSLANMGELLDKFREKVILARAAAAGFDPTKLGGGSGGGGAGGGGAGGGSGPLVAPRSMASPDFLIDQARIDAGQMTQAEERDSMRRSTQLAEEMQRLRDEELQAVAAFNAGMDDLNLQRLIADREAVEERYRLQQDERQANQSHFDALKSTAVEGIASMTGNIIGGLITGATEIQDAGKAFFGGLLSIAGGMLTQLGTAALAAAMGSTVIPWLAPIFGGPAGIAGAAGLIAAGGTLSALGSAMSSSARGASAGASAAVGRSAPRMPDFGRGFMGPTTATAAASPYNVTVNFNGVVTDPRRTAREIRDVMQRGR